MGSCGNGVEVNCKSCGAPLTNSMKCDYCGTNNQFTEADCKDYIVEMEFDGAKRKFFVSNVTYVSVGGYDCGRLGDGTLVRDKPILKRKIELMEW